MSEVIDYMNTEAPKLSRIMVIGVGGGGGNAVKYMYDIGVHNVYFMVCNTDAQALQRSPIPQKIQLGSVLTKGLGAGNKPEKGREAALESAEDIKQTLLQSEVEMVFITAGMGGGTGTGAAPVIAEIAKDLGILTVGIVTIPFRLEGPVRLRQACEGLNALEQHVDSMIVIDNENICKMYGDLDFSEAFSKADDILTIAAKGIAETITKEHRVNVDFADISTIMSNSGIVLLGYASAEIGPENIAIELTEKALISPLLNQNNIYGAEKILINISWNKSELRMGQLHAIIQHIQAAAGSNSNIIWGAGVDETLGENEVCLIIIATGFPNSSLVPFLESQIDGGNTQKAINKPSIPNNTASSEEVIEIETVEVTNTNTENISEGTEYVTFDDEATQHEETPVKKEQDNDEDGGIILSITDSDEPAETKPTNIETKAINVEQKSKVPKSESYVKGGANSLFDLQENDKINNIISQSTKTPQPHREYTADELETMPAYIRRNLVSQLNQKLPSNDKKTIKLD